jgi:Fe-S-cluster-containing hydrogenase component 2
MCSLGAVLEGDPQYSIDKEKCISCEACTGICPVGALMESGE